MLRITRSETIERGATTHRVEGRLVAESVEALASECRRSLSTTPRVRLDLSGVTFIDGRDVSILKDLRDCCLEILNCPSFVEGLLAGPRDRRAAGTRWLRPRPGWRTAVRMGPKGLAAGRASSSRRRSGIVSTCIAALLGLCRSAVDAEDLVQETYLCAFRFFDQFTPGTHCRAWLLTMLRNAFVDRVTRDAREVLGRDESSVQRASGPAVGPRHTRGRLLPARDHRPAPSQGPGRALPQIPRSLDPRRPRGALIP